MPITPQQIKELAQACGFELAGIASALPTEDFERFEAWRAEGMAGEMTYLNDQRGDLRNDPRNLLPAAQSIVCVGKLYNTPHPYSTQFNEPDCGWISRYAWGADYHDVLRSRLELLVKRIAEVHGEPFDWKICVDTAPLLERSYARAAGLGWIGKNTCLINQEQGSWFFLGEILLSIPLTPDSPPPDRCGTCRRCIDACPTEAIVPAEDGTWRLDARLCVSYLTIEKRGEIPEEIKRTMANHLFGCDICQDVCPWNRAAPVSSEQAFQPANFAPSLDGVAELTEEEFRTRFRRTPVWRAKHRGFLRNAAIAIRNAARAALVSVLMVCSGFGSTPAVKLEDPLANPGFVHFYNLEFDDAITYFEKEVKDHPRDPEAYNHLAQSILYREMLRNGALETQLVSGTNPFLRRPKMAISTQDKNRFIDCVNRSVKLTETSLDKHPQDIRSLYALGVAHGLRATYSFLVQKAWIDSLREATAARKADQQILEIDPNFIDARLILGLDEYVMGCLPFHLRAVGFLAGFHGDKEGGIQELEQVRISGILNRYDAEVLLAAIYRRERLPQKAIPLLQDAAAKFPRNYLLHFEQVEMYSDLGDKTSALRVLAQLEDLRAHGAPGYRNLPPEKIKYLKGNLLFWYGDLDPALANLKQVTRKADQLDLGTAVLAWLRVGQIYDLKGNHAQAVAAYRETMKTAPESEAATEAKSYISNPYRRKRTSG